MPRIVRGKQRRAGDNRAKSAFQNECQHALETGDYASSISRAFYAMLFATRAALRTRELDPSTHKGVFTLFNEHFIQSNELPRHLSNTLRRTMDVRQLADYAEDEAGFGEEEATSILEDAQHFVEQLRRYLT